LRARRPLQIRNPFDSPFPSAERTASNSIVTFTTLTDSVIPQAGWRRRAQQQMQATKEPGVPAAATGYVWSADADASTAPYTGWAAGAATNETTAAASVSAAGDTVGAAGGWDDGGFPTECGANIVTGGRTVRLLLSFNNDFNPSPFSAATVLTNIETCVPSLPLLGCGAATHVASTAPDDRTVTRQSHNNQIPTHARSTCLQDHGPCLQGGRSPD
jgi:hypothetical protein